MTLRSLFLPLTSLLVAACAHPAPAPTTPSVLPAAEAPPSSFALSEQALRLPNFDNVSTQLLLSAHKVFVDDAHQRLLFVGYREASLFDLATNQVVGSIDVGASIENVHFFQDQILFACPENVIEWNLPTATSRSLLPHSSGGHRRIVDVSPNGRFVLYIESTPDDAVILSGPNSDLYLPTRLFDRQTQRHVPIERARETPIGLAVTDSFVVQLLLHEGRVINPETGALLHTFAISEELPILHRVRVDQFLAIVQPSSSAIRRELRLELWTVSAQNVRREVLQRVGELDQVRVSPGGRFVSIESFGSSPMTRIYDVNARRFAHRVAGNALYWLSDDAIAVSPVEGTDIQFLHAPTANARRWAPVSFPENSENMQGFRGGYVFLDTTDEPSHWRIAHEDAPTHTLEQTIPWSPELIDVSNTGFSFALPSLGVMHVSSQGLRFEETERAPQRDEESSGARRLSAYPFQGEQEVNGVRIELQNDHLAIWHGERGLRIDISANSSWYLSEDAAHLIGIDVSDNGESYVSVHRVSDAERIAHWRAYELVSQEPSDQRTTTVRSTQIVRMWSDSLVLKRDGELTHRDLLTGRVLQRWRAEVAALGEYVSEPWIASCADSTSQEIELRDALGHVLRFSGASEQCSQDNGRLVMAALSSPDGRFMVAQHTDDLVITRLSDRRMLRIRFIKLDSSPESPLEWMAVDSSGAVALSAGMASHTLMREAAGATHAPPVTALSDQLIKDFFASGGVSRSQSN